MFSGEGFGAGAFAICDGINNGVVLFVGLGE